MNALKYLNNLGFPLTASDIISNSSKTVVVGLSGGVDSSVSALLLKMMGYRVIGIYMKNWHTCSSDDYSDVIKIADAIDIPYYSINLVDDYATLVFDSFINDLNNGLTPNPDILCNKYIKFDVFYKYAKMLGADYLATGHYCAIENLNNFLALKMPKDLSKDQTYFLYGINPSVLSSVLFPLSTLDKSTVRLIASDFNLATASKKDSTGICFIGNSDYRLFINDYIKKTKGHFIDINTNILGTHDGLGFYTIGQKKGLNLKFKSGSLIAKTYGSKTLVIAKKNFKDNTILLVDGNSSLLKTKIINVRDKTSDYNGSCFIRTSNLGILHSALMDNNTITLDNDINIVAPGQSVVCYSRDGFVLCGSIAV